MIVLAVALLIGLIHVACVENASLSRRENRIDDAADDAVCKLLGGEL